MTPTRAPHRDRQVMTSLTLVSGDQDLEEVPESCEEPVGCPLIHHVIDDLVVETTKRPQVVHPVWVREESHVEDDVRIEGQSVLVAERDDGDLEALLSRSCLEVRSHLGPQLPDGEIRRIDQQVGTLAERFHQFALSLDAHRYVLLGGQRVHPPARIEPPHQHLIGSFEEDESEVAHVSSELLEFLHGLREEGSPACVDHEGDPLYPGVRGEDQRHHLRYKGGREVVDHEPAEIL